jgi:hypothetical protein
LSAYTETLGDLLSYLDIILPNALTTATKVILINDEIKEIWRNMSPTILYEFNTAVDTIFYDLPSHTTFDQIYNQGLTISTEIGTPSDDTVFNTYSFCASEDALQGYSYFNGLENNIGIYPTPDAIYAARLKIIQYPTLFATTDTAITLTIDQDYIKLLKLRVLSRIAKSGSFPRIDLANNYYMDSVELERRMKYIQKMKKSKDRRKIISYKEGWSY